MKKKYRNRFILLALIYSLFVFLSIYFIEGHIKKNHFLKISYQSQQLSAKTLEILNNDQLYDKLSAIKFIFNNYQKSENSFSFYQISKKHNGIYQPLFMGKAVKDPVVLVHLNDLVNPNGQVQDGFIQKAPYLIYHQDMITEKQYYGKLFIAYTGDNINNKINTLYLQVIAFSIVVFCLSILLFFRLRKKLERA